MPCPLVGFSPLVSLNYSGVLGMGTWRVMLLLCIHETSLLLLIFMPVHLTIVRLAVIAEWASRQDLGPTPSPTSRLQAT